MASENYLAKRRRATSERNSVRGKYGNEVNRQLMQERVSDLLVVGGFTTWGSLGNHTIELLSCDDPLHIWIRVDGEIRQPRTMRGFFSVMNRWVWSANNNTKQIGAK